MSDQLKKKIAVANNSIRHSLSRQDFDHLGLAFFNLKKGECQTIEFHEGSEEKLDFFYYDLASLTKPLTMGALWAKEPSLFDESLNLLLEHRGSLPRWAILGRKSWRQTVESFAIKEGETLYSDLSFLRLMLEIEKKTGKNLKELCSFYWDSELCYWQDLPEEAYCPVTGFRQGDSIQGEVNDDNCFKINRFCSHAGLFSTLNGLYRSLLNLQEETEILGKMQAAFKEKQQQRFFHGFDTVSDSSSSLAGIGCPPMTFGHLGFTGTSFWIDAESGMGWILLTNATKKYWFHREELNRLRRELGEILWS
ncbi:MAG: serine hydrolase [Bdellovibrionota bacterium]|nr:serine hydrolase [Bdellovibrionota bacterium]